MDALTIRSGRPDDAEALFSIHRESAMTAYVEVFPPDRYRFPEEEMRAHWVSVLDDPECAVVLAERGGVPVGFASVSRGWLRNLFVVPGEWSHGVGGALHDAAVELLRGHGTTAHLWVLEENARARRFYESRGWRDDGGRSNSQFPPHPLELQYSLDLSAEVAPIPNPHPPKGIGGRG
jgi:GNAT superfamily N-acetyltransferase